MCWSRYYCENNYLFIIWYYCKELVQYVAFLILTCKALFLQGNSCRVLLFAHAYRLLLYAVFNSQCGTAKVLHLKVRERVSEPPFHLTALN